MNQSQVETKNQSALRASSAVESSQRYRGRGQALTLTHTPSYAALFGWNFQWTPVLSLAHNQVDFSSAAYAGSSADFQYLRTSIGMGPELAWTSLIGTFYTNLVPELTYSWGSWSSSGQRGDVSQADWNVALTAGYFKYVTRDWIVRVFVRQSFEGTEVWNKTVTAMSNSDLRVEKVSNSLAAVSVAYVF
ncbi:hypothetical protein D3C87_253310 [compost metagenome]